MRTTVTLDEDVAAEIARLRREGLGLSDALNRLARAGMARSAPRITFEQRTAEFDLRFDITDVAGVEALLDEMTARDEIAARDEP